jgi:hypothetical protein
VAARGKRPRNRKADDPCPDDQDVYDRLLSIEVPRIIEGIIVRAWGFRRCRLITAKDGEATALPARFEDI